MQGTLNNVCKKEDLFNSDIWVKDTVNYGCLSVVPYGIADEAYSLTHGGPYGIKWCRVHSDVLWLEDTAWLPELGRTPSYMYEVTCSYTERPGLGPAVR